MRIQRFGTPSWMESTKFCGGGEPREAGIIRWLVLFTIVVSFFTGVALERAKHVPLGVAPDKAKAMDTLAKRNKLKDEDLGNFDRITYAEIYDVPVAFVEAVAGTEAGEAGYQMGQKIIFPGITLVTKGEEQAQTAQAARTLDRFAWRFLLENPELGTTYCQSKKRGQWEQEDFLMTYRSRYLEYLAHRGWPDKRVDDCVQWRKNMAWFVAKWEEEHK